MNIRSRYQSVKTKTRQMHKVTIWLYYFCRLWLRSSRNGLGPDPVALEIVSNPTQLSLNSLWLDPFAFEAVYDQTQAHLKPVMIRIKCAPSWLWSDLCALQSTSDETQLRKTISSAHLNTGMVSTHTWGWKVLVVELGIFNPSITLFSYFALKNVMKRILSDL